MDCFRGISITSGALAAIIIGSQPLFAALVAQFIMKSYKLIIGKFLSISLGIVGVVIISYNKFDSNQGFDGEFLGILILILANISSGIGNVFVSKTKQDISPFVLNSSQLIMGGFILYTISLFIEDVNISIKPPEFYFSLIWLAFLSAAAFSLWFYLLQRPHVKVSDLNIWKFIIPVFGAIFSWTILPNETPELVSIIGMVIIGGSLLMLNYINRKRKI